MLLAAPPPASPPAFEQPAPTPTAAGEPFPVYQLQLDRELIFVGLGVAAWLAFYARDRANLPDPCPAPAGCDAQQINGLDRFAVDQHSSGADLASDVTRALAVAYPAALELYMLRSGGSERRRGVLADAFVDGEVLLITSGLTSLFEQTAERLRPSVYRQAPLPPGTQRSSDDFNSFPSGHTSSAFAAASAGCVTFVRRMRPSGRSALVACAPGFALAVATGMLRVAAGRHFPTDVISGAALGITVGVAVPLLHHDPRSPQSRLVATLAPAPGGLVLHLAGRF
ncbi:MAG TPA: phosphatase PAP2 family protein [Polyangia bacterium]|nr:phosphatase PAP2 family protein [Polyangia bacterium]